MRLFHGTIEALSLAQEIDRDAFAVVTRQSVGRSCCACAARSARPGQPCGRGPAGPCRRPNANIRKFAPALARGAPPSRRPEALTRSWPRSSCSSSSTSPASARFRRTHRCRSARRAAASPLKDGEPNWRLYETAVLATLRNKLRSSDVWVERPPATAALIQPDGGEVRAKRKGGTARDRLKEAWSKIATRRTETGYEAGHGRTSGQPVAKSISIKGQGCKSGGAARKAAGLTPGDLRRVRRD